MKLIDDTINVNLKDLGVFLELLTAFAGEQKLPYLVDSAQSLKDHLWDVDSDIKADFETWSKGQIKFT